MAVVTIPYSFVPNTVIASAQVNANFNALVAYINTNSGSSIAASGFIILPGALYVQWATATGVAYDGSSASAVSFPTAFPTACFGVIPIPKNVYQTNAWQLSSQFDTPTTSGCNINVSGAPPGTTGSVFYVAIGN
jgi:hypothetical protein